MKKLIIPFLWAISGISNAAMVTVSAVPTTWVAENYVPGYVVLWFTGSSCPNGQLSLPSTSGVVDHSRLFATILSAKTAGTRVNVNYDNAAAGCPISSFSVQ